MSRKPILVLDFDGVIHSYTSGWLGANVVPDPVVPGAARFILDALEHFRVEIYSSRSEDMYGIEAMRNYVAVCLGKELGDPMQGILTAGEKIGWPTHKPPAMVTIDDRAIQFTGKWPSIDDLRNFKPWNKRPTAKPDWIDRGAWIGESLAFAIGLSYSNITPKRTEDPNAPGAGLELPHLLFMALELKDRKLDSETKVCRWLGWLQAGMVHHGIASLEIMKEFNLQSGTEASK